MMTLELQPWCDGRVRCSAWLGGMALLLLLALQLSQLFGGGRTPAERCLHVVMDTLHRLRLRVCNWQLRARAKFLRGVADLLESRFKLVRLCAECLDFLYGVFVGHISVNLVNGVVPPNDPSSATGPAKTPEREGGAQ